ncbi:MAG: C4-dicarboxylic acid transporter DauA [Thermoanaerobaculia bacterium]
MALTRYQGASAAPSLMSLPAAALRAVLREGYSATDLRRDALAGAVVGTVALPLSMALSIAVGAPPQYGLYTAIVAGFVVALLGGSRTQVTGPTAAFVVVLAPIHARFGDAGLFTAGLLAGVMLITFGLLRLGKLIEFIPHPVTTGFTAGIATVIATLQVKDLLGLRLTGNPEHFFDRIVAMWRARATASWPELTIGLATLVLLLGLPLVTRRIPAPLVALPAAAILALVLARLVPGFSVSTIASRFSFVVGGVTVHGIPRLPPLPLFPWNAPGPEGAAGGLSLAMLRAASRGAFAIAMLAAIESLLSAVVADGMARTKHDPDAELFALGVGNLVAPFFGGIPATGAIARTATNIRSGGRSPFAAMIHAATVLVAVLLLAPLMGYLPMASLAALLLLVAWNMSEVRFFAHTVRVAPKSDVAILLTCYVLTVAIDMVVSVSVGVVLAALLFMRRMAEVTEARVFEGGSHESTGPLPPGVVVYDIDGPLFFGAAQKAMAALGVVDRKARAVILRMEGVPALDSTGLVALESALDLLRAHRCMAVITGLRPQPEGALRKAEVEARHKVRLARDLPEALALIERVKGVAAV